MTRIKNGLAADKNNQCGLIAESMFKLLAVNQQFVPDSDISHVVHSGLFSSEKGVISHPVNPVYVDNY
jgi:hypothetical protein